MGLQDLFSKKKAGSKKAGEAAATEATDVVADEAPDDIPFGLDLWVKGVDPVVDIIAVHGLNGHREKTWTAKNKVNWLRDANMLSSVIPNARIMSWGYDANTHSTERLSAMYLYDHAQNLVSDLSLYRRVDNTDTRPIIFVAHSLGGIVLKSALIHSDSARSSHLHHHRSIKTSTYGIMFMGTPHQGGEGVAWGQRLVNVASIFVNTNNKLLNILEQDSEFLQQQLSQYNAISSDFETKFAYETKPTPLALGKAMIIVPKSSAVVPGQVDAEPIAIMDHHINMVKFETKSKEFTKVAGHLKLMVDKAPTRVQKNWVTEGGIEAARVGNLKPTFDVSFDLTGVPKTSAFIGRRLDLDLIEKQLTTGERDRRKMCVIYGLGGMGKTQLAIEYARLHKDLYTSFFWIDGKTEESLIQSLLRIASRIPRDQISGIDTQTISGLDESRKAAQEVLKWFTLKGNTRWLLVFDNIDKTSYEEESNQHIDSSFNITHYFPKSDTGSIIVTTRLHRLASLGGPVPLRKLSVLDGLFILENHTRRSLRRIGRQMTSEYGILEEDWDPDAVTLVERLDGLPLALVFAGSYISKTTIVKYVELYNKSWQELHGQMINRADYPERTITTTWQISFNEVERRDTRAAKLLRLWGFLDNQELWYQLLRWPRIENAMPDWLQQITATEINFLATVGTLLDFSLIEQNANSETYSMHAVVHDWIQASIDIEKDNDLLRTAIITIGLGVPPDITRDSPTIERRLLPHLVQFLKYWSNDSNIQDYADNPIYLDSLQMLGMLCNRQGKLADAEKMYQRALQGYEKALGPEHTSTLLTFNNLGILYKDQGKLIDAEKMYQRALQGYEKALGPEHTSTLHIVGNLGNLYKDQGKLIDAEKMYQRALQGYEKALGPEHTLTLRTVGNLGLLYADQGKLVNAEKMYQRALQGYEKALGPEHTSTLLTFNNLGSLYADQGKLADAEKIYQRALQGYEKALGPEHTSTLRTVGNLGSLYKDQGKLIDAEKMYRRALQGYEKALGPEHTSTLRTVGNLGNLYADQGKLVDAEKMYQRALQGYEKALGPEHTSTLLTFNNLGLLYADQGKLADAEKIYQRALQGYEKALGPEHTSTLRTVGNLGSLYKDQGKLIDAEKMYQRALQGYEKALGPEHTSTLRTVGNLGNLYADQGKLVDAEKMYQRALQGYEKALGPEHTSTLLTFNNLGSLYADQGKLIDAEKMYQRALQGYKKALGPEHTSTLRTVGNLGILYTDQGKLIDAEKMYQRALQGYEKALGVENTSRHIPALNAIWGLGSLFERQEDLVNARIMYSKALVGYEKVFGPNHPKSGCLRDKLRALDQR